MTTTATSAWPRESGEEASMATAETAAVIDERVPVTVSEPIHVRWVALPTKQHLPEDDCDLPGTGPDGWGLCEEDEEGQGYFAWVYNKPEAENVVEQHNAAVETAEELEAARDELEALRAEVKLFGLRRALLDTARRGRLEAFTADAGTYLASDLPLLYALAEEER